MTKNPCSHYSASHYSASHYSASHYSAALVVAHPGHELRVHAWLECARPRVFVLTDGSGHGEVGRLDSTARILRQSGASYDSTFGGLRDRDVYQMILDGDLGKATALITELAERLQETEVDLVASDAVEGFNPVHDLCSVLADGAAHLVARRTGRRLRRYDFPLVGAPDSRPADGQIRIELDEPAWRRKLEAAWAYEELRQEVERGMKNHGADAFRVEVLRPMTSDSELSDGLDERPAYEIYGEERVAEGVYGQVLRYREHFLPLAEAIRAWTEPA